MKHISPEIDIAAQDRAIDQIVTHLLKDQDRIAIYGLMLAHGKRFYMSERTFAGRRGGKKKCYLNAYELAAADQHNIEYWRKRFHLDPGCNPVYVEGWCYVEPMIIEHAWCLDQNGQVIDPTLREGHASGYFGIPLRWDYVWRTVSRTGMIYGIITFRNPELLTTPVKEFLYDPV
jgi:hypothetical protein